MDEIQHFWMILGQKNYLCISVMGRNTYGESDFVALSGNVEVFKPKAYGYSSRSCFDHAVCLSQGRYPHIEPSVGYRSLFGKGLPQPPDNKR